MSRAVKKQPAGWGSAPIRVLSILAYPPITILAVLVLIGAWYLLAPMLRAPAGPSVANSSGSAATDAAVFTPERVTRLTDSGAADRGAALSSDGRYVVHIKREGGLFSVWVRQTATTSDVQIVPPAETEILGLTFSPDGNYVYYAAEPRGGMSGLYRIPTLGGPPIRLLEDIEHAPAFSPDGRRMAFIRGARSLMVAAADGTSVRRLAAPTGGLGPQFEPRRPAWSPDGQTILVVARRGDIDYTLVAVDAGTGTIREVSGVWPYLESPAWMPDGKSFLISAGTSSSLTPQLWQVAYPSGAPRRITTDLNGYRDLSLSGDGRLLATVQSTPEATIWVVPAGGGEGKAITLTPGRNWGSGGLAWTPDGHHLVFIADVAGYVQVWIAPAHGGEARQLTRYDAVIPLPMWPVVSPDGRWIYYFLLGNDSQIWRMGMDGSDQRVLTTGPNAYFPLVSPDSQWVYFTSSEAKRPYAAMKMKADGSQVSRLSEVLFEASDVSPDGTELIGVASNDEKKRLEFAVLPVGGGAPRLLGEEASSWDRVWWTPDGAFFTYLAYRDGHKNLFGRPRGGGREHQITRFADGVGISCVAWARDGRLAISRETRASDVVLIAAK